MLYYTHVSVCMSNHASFGLVHNCPETSYVIVANHANSAVKPGNSQDILSKAKFDFVCTHSG